MLFILPFLHILLHLNIYILCSSITTAHSTSLVSKAFKHLFSLFDFLTPMGSFRFTFIILHCGVWAVNFCLQSTQISIDIESKYDSDGLSHFIDDAVLKPVYFWA